MRCNRLTVTIGLIGLLAFAGTAKAAQEQAGPWTLATDGGGIVTMSYPNPPTRLGNVQLLELDLGADGFANQGRLTFKDGIKRDMSKEEVAFYYALLDGPIAAWDFLAANKDRVTKYSPATATLPATLAGRFVRVILQNGTNFFGTLAFESTRPSGFVVKVDRASGGPIQFENKIVREVQVTK